MPFDRRRRAVLSGGRCLVESRPTESDLGQLANVYLPVVTRDSGPTAIHRSRPSTRTRDLVRQHLVSARVVPIFQAPSRKTHRACPDRLTTRPRTTPTARSSSTRPAWPRHALPTPSRHRHPPSGDAAGSSPCSAGNSAASESPGRPSRPTRNPPVTRTPRLHRVAPPSPSSATAPS
jgi:hypothetical protein